MVYLRRFENRFSVFELCSGRLIGSGKHMLIAKPITIEFAKRHHFQIYCRFEVPQRTHRHTFSF